MLSPNSRGEKIEGTYASLIRTTIIPLTKAGGILKKEYLPAARTSSEYPLARGGDYYAYTGQPDQTTTSLRPE